MNEQTFDQAKKLYLLFGSEISDIWDGNLDVIQKISSENYIPVKIEAEYFGYVEPHPNDAEYDIIEFTERFYQEMEEENAKV